MANTIPVRQSKLWKLSVYLNFVKGNMVEIWWNPGVDVTDKFFLVRNLHETALLTWDYLTGSAAGQKKPEIASYAVQIGAFKSLAAAEKVQARLKQEGLNTSVVKATFADGSVWYRVRMAAHLPRPEAEALASRLKKDGNLNPALIPVK
mgnify:CR=1 FL=1